MIVMQAQKKVLEGYMQYFEKREDANLQEALNRYGQDAFYIALELWTKDKNIEGVLDPSEIPVKEIIQMLSEKNYKLISHP